VTLLSRQGIRIFGAGLLSMVLLGGFPGIIRAQDDEAARNATREKVRAALNEVGPKIGVSFRQSDRQPFNFVGSLTDGLTNASSMEILVMIGHQDIVTIQIYPHTASGGYINVDKAVNGAGLMRKLLSYNDGGFFYWGIDDVYDCFAAFTITLESGFPNEVVDIVMRSVPLLDKKVGEIALLVGS
jgi:hypothetical protein